MRLLNIAARNANFLLRRLTGPIRRLPDFVVIGVQKGGTRFLYHCLAQHPNIALPRSKEVHFFDRDFGKGLNWYKAFFPLKMLSKNKVVGEITPRYMVDKEVSGRCSSTLPNAKIIVLLRDPIQRAHSHYHMTLRGFQMEMSFREFVDNTLKEVSVEIQKKGSEAISLGRLRSLERGLYSEQIKLWFEHYSRENFLFIESESLFQNPETALKKVYEFLDVPVIFPADLTPQHTGQYTKEIDDSTRKLLEDYFKESNDWLKKEGFELEWLKL